MDDNQVNRWFIIKNSSEILLSFIDSTLESIFSDVSIYYSYTSHFVQHRFK